MLGECSLCVLIVAFDAEASTNQAKHRRTPRPVPAGASLTDSEAAEGG
jgi:hypothetical protein